MDNPLHFALVVGISYGLPGGYPALFGPKNDAKAFVEWVTSPSGGGVPETNLACCITPEGDMTLEDALPTKRDIDDKLWALRKKAVKAYDELPEDQRTQVKAQTSRLYIYLAGHGILPGGGTTALLDAQAQDERSTNLEIRRYEDWFRLDGTFAEVCIFADCCRNFVLLAPEGGPSFPRPGGHHGRVFSLVGYASSEGERAYEESERYDPDVSPSDRRGYFSRALIDGLAGQAAHPKTGYVTAEYLQTYVSFWVSKRTANRPAHQRQAIEMKPDPSHPMTFGPRRLVPPKRRRVVIHFPPGFVGDVDLIGPDGSSIYWQASKDPWIVMLHDGIWIVQHADTNRDTAGFAENGAFSVIGADRDVQL